MGNSAHDPNAWYRTCMTAGAREDRMIVPVCGSPDGSDVYLYLPSRCWAMCLQLALAIGTALHKCE